MFFQSPSTSSSTSSLPPDPTPPSTVPEGSSSVSSTSVACAAAPSIPKEIKEAYNKALEKSNGKMKLNLEEFSKRIIEKAEKSKLKGPIDITNDEQLKALWGTLPKFDRDERVAVIAKMFTDAGLAVENIGESKRSSTLDKGLPPPILFDIKGLSTISKFEIHPGGGIHAAPYIRISTNKGMIKIYNSKIKPEYISKDENTFKTLDVNK